MLTRRSPNLRHPGPLLSLIGPLFLVFPAIGATAQSAALPQAASAGSSVLPDSPVPAIQPESRSMQPSSDPGANSSSLLEDSNDDQDQQNPPQSGQSDDTLKKPIQQNPVSTRNPQTKRILGIVPNFRSVSTDEKLPP